jgi:hypothetical protein
MTKECYFLKSKFTLVELSVELVRSQLFQNHSLVLLMFFDTLRVNKYVVNENYDKLI